MAIFHPEPDCPSHARQSLTGTRWQITAPVERVPARQHPAIGQVLAARGIVTDADVDAFLHAGFSVLHDPFLLNGMAAAVDAVQDALARKARIRVFGDYDADGITATALLVRALTALGGVVDWYLPHRIDDGYGLNLPALEEAHAEGVELGITVDNGITAHAQLAHAQQIGLRMVVTDHHEPDGALPPALAVLNPKRADNTYPFRDLAGVGVAFTLLRGVCAARGLPPHVAAKFLDLVTIGTITDVCPLIGENRILVREGLPQLTPHSKKLGIGALLRAAGIAEVATCTNVAYLIGPRLNAAGRVAHAADALRLLLTNDRGEADSLAERLCAHNAQRQEEEARTLEQALAMVEAEHDLAREKVLVLASADWHPGIIGIVASRLVERFNRPAALIAIQDGVGKGSARARAPFHLWEALESCSALLRRFGGHRVAAGFEVDAANIPAFRTAMNAIADRTLTDDDLQPSLAVDACIDLPEVTTAFIRQVEALAPFGYGNPQPVFAASDAYVQSHAQRGQDGSHLSLSLRAEPGGRPLNAIWFRHGHLYDRIRPGARVDLAFTVGLNLWQGITYPQLVIKDIMA